MERNEREYENSILCHLPDSKLNRGAAVTRSRMPAGDEVTIGHPPDETRRQLKRIKDHNNLLSAISITLIDACGRKWALRITVCCYRECFHSEINRRFHALHKRLFERLRRWVIVSQVCK